MASEPADTASGRVIPLRMPPPSSSRSRRSDLPRTLLGRIDAAMPNSHQPAGPCPPSRSPREPR
jgi:hypothetical protein